MKVFISGASGGIGAGLARLYAARGASLGLCARRADALQRLAAQLGVPAACYAADVSDPRQVQDAAERFLERFGTPDIVIANAGISIGTLTEKREDVPVLKAIMDTNVLGLAATLQPFVAPMRERGGGILAGIASVAGFRGLPGGGAYSASKAAAVTLLESLRVELAGSGVRVVAVCPGYVRTAMTAGNPYRMPFLLEADEAARRIAAAIEKRRGVVVVPWQMALVSLLLRAMPERLYDRVFARAPRKPRLADRAG